MGAVGGGIGSEGLDVDQMWQGGDDGRRRWGAMGECEARCGVVSRGVAWRIVVWRNVEV